MTQHKVQVQLSPRNVISICRIVYYATRQLRAELGQTGGGVDWEVLPDTVRNEVEANIRAIAGGRMKSPEVMHNVWRTAKINDGWSWGMVKDVEQQKHPAICAFDELPIMEQAKYNVFFALASTLIVHYAGAQVAGDLS
jgi:hypothetical protein